MKVLSFFIFLLIVAGIYFQQEKIPHPLHIIQAETVHQRGILGKGILVAVIDEGFDSLHPLFEGRISPLAYNVDTEDSDISETLLLQRNDVVLDNHGTHVAGLVLQVAPEATILPIKIGTKGGEQSLVKALLYAAKSPARVVSISLRLSLFGYTLTSNMEDALRQIVASGKIIVIAAGNESLSLYQNRYLSKLLALARSEDMENRLLIVGATAYANNETLAKFSNFPGSSYNDEIPFLAAPGENILSNFSGGKKGRLSGTSMATPLVAGACALLLSTSPFLDPASVGKAILKAARKESVQKSFLSPYFFGQGILNVEDSLTYLRGQINR